MNLIDFKTTFDQEAPPHDLGVPLEALWWAGKGEWKTSHELLQDQPDDNGSAWVHAWLHREEGDIPNAKYWYNRANKPPVSMSLQAEWDDIAQNLLANPV